MLTAKVEIIPDCSSISVGQLGGRKLKSRTDKCGHSFSMGWKYQRRKDLLIKITGTRA